MRYEHISPNTLSQVEIFIFSQTFSTNISWNLTKSLKNWDQTYLLRVLKKI